MARRLEGLLVALRSAADARKIKRPGVSISLVGGPGLCEGRSMADTQNPARKHLVPVPTTVHASGAAYMQARKTTSEYSCHDGWEKLPEVLDATCRWVPTPTNKTARA